MNKSRPSPMRFPRLINASISGELTRQIWRTLKFSVREPDNATEFVHRLPLRIPEGIRGRQSAAFHTLFSFQAVDIKKEIEEAYGRATYKGIPVGRLINGALRKVLTVAMAEIFSKARKSDNPYARYLKGGRKAFARAARPRRAPQAKLRRVRAIRLARLYDDKVLPRAREILDFLKQYGPKNKNEDELRRDLEEKFLKRWIAPITRGEALQHLPEIPGHEARQTLSNLDCTPRQLAVGIVWSIENRRGERPSLSAITILETYLPLGRKLSENNRSTRRS